MNKQIKHKIINGIKHKWCHKCERYKTLDCFNRDSRAIDKLTKTCKDCLSKGNKRGRPYGYVMSETSKQIISKKLSNRTLSKEHKENLAISMIDNKNGKGKAVIINNTYYSTINQAAEGEKICHLTIRYRLKTNKPGYKYANN